MPDADTNRMSPGEFLKSQRFSIIVCCVLLAAVFLAAVFSVDPAYNYPRLITDQLRYYMKGLSFVEHGTTAARSAVNVAPFTFAATPGLLRAPLIAAFADFDDQLRAIQVSNIGLAMILGIMSAYVVSWVLPRPLHSTALGFSFVTLVLNPVWVTNILSPLADLPYAVASLGALIALNRMIRGSDAEKSSTALKVLFVLLFVVAFGCRYTAPVLLVYGWMLFRQDKTRRGVERASVRRAFIAGGVALAILVAIDFRTIVFGYIWQPVHFLTRDGPAGLLLNTAALGIPSQIIPGLELLYRVPPLDVYNPRFGTNPFDLGLTLAALGITGVVAHGMWRGRRSYAAEIVYILLPLPVLALMIPSTARYLLSYQPLIWSFLWLGASPLAMPVASRLRRRTATIAAGIFFFGVVAGAVLYIRSSRVTGIERATMSSFSLGESRRHASEVASTYRSLRNYLESLQRDRALVVGDRASTGQWKVIAGIDYYELDSALVSASRTRDLYLVMNCQSKLLCSGFDRAITKREERILKYGTFEFDGVFASRNDYSAAIVYRVRAVN